MQGTLDIPTAHVALCLAPCARVLMQLVLHPDLGMVQTLLTAGMRAGVLQEVWGKAPCHGAGGEGRRSSGSGGKEEEGWKCTCPGLLDASSHTHPSAGYSGPQQDSSLLSPYTPTDVEHASVVQGVSVSAQPQACSRLCLPELLMC